MYLFHHTHKFLLQKTSYEIGEKLWENIWEFLLTKTFFIRWFIYNFSINKKIANIFGKIFLLSFEKLQDHPWYIEI